MAFRSTVTVVCSRKSSVAPASVGHDETSRQPTNVKPARAMHTAARPALIHASSLARL
jgi:hypothetical protein